MGWAHGRGASTPTDSSATLPSVQRILFTAPVLEQLTCEQSSGTLRRLLRVAPSQQPLLQAYRVLACNGSRAAREERFAQLAAELRDQMDTPKIVSRVSVGPGLGAWGGWWGRAVPDYFSPATRGCAGTLGRLRFLRCTSVHVLACPQPAGTVPLPSPKACWLQGRLVSPSGHLIRHCLLDVVSPASSMLVPPAGPTQGSLGAISELCTP